MNSDRSWLLADTIKMPLQFKDELAVQHKLRVLTACTLRQVIRGRGCDCGASCSAPVRAQNVRFNLTNNLPRGSFLLGGKAELAGKDPFKLRSCLNPLQAKVALL